MTAFSCSADGGVRNSEHKALGVSKLFFSLIQPIANLTSISCKLERLSNSRKIDFMSESKNYSHFIGGFAGGLTSSVILQPFDLIKTRVQQSKNATIRSTLANLHSYKELWRGTLPSALRTSIGSALYLTSLNGARSFLSKSGKMQNATSHKVVSSSLPKLSMTENLVTGGITRGFVGFLTMPITVIKVRYESTLYNYGSLWESIVSTAKNEGLRGFFNGFTATAARDAPYSGLYVLLYEQLKTALPSILRFHKEGESEIINNQMILTTSKSALVNSISAFSSATLATTITAPFDTIKTKMQLQSGKFTKFTKTLMYIIKEEGFIRLFDGLSLRLTRKAFSAGIAWGIYEEIVKTVTKGY